MWANFLETLWLRRPQVNLNFILQFCHANVYFALTVSREATTPYTRFVAVIFMRIYVDWLSLGTNFSNVSFTEL